MRAVQKQQNRSSIRDYSVRATEAQVMPANRPKCNSKVFACAGWPADQASAGQLQAADDASRPLGGRRGGSLFQTPVKVFS
jgi:hypothetical protein